MTTLYRGGDDGTLYRRDEIDNPADFQEIVVPDAIILDPDQVTGHYGDILEILLAAGQARVK